jgi:hypothetical protein
MTRGPLTNEEVRSVLRRVLAGDTRDDVAARFGIARSTVDRYCSRVGLHLRRQGNRSPDRDWMSEAACVPYWRDFTEWAWWRQQETCQGCPVRNKCLGYGLVHSVDGWPRGEGPVWGGMTPPDLGRLKKRQREASAA